MNRFLIAIFGLVGTCSAPNEGRVPQHMRELIGKTIAYQYGESVYHVTFDTDSTLHWEAMKGDEKGAFENETYVAEFVAPGMLFITWGEENGIGVSQVLNFAEGQVHNHLLRGREASLGEGEIEIIQNP